MFGSMGLALRGPGGTVLCHLEASPLLFCFQNTRKLAPPAARVWNAGATADKWHIGIDIASPCTGNRNAGMALDESHVGKLP